MKIKTELLKKLVNKSINGASNNKLIPITQLMGISKTENNIMLTTTDATNYLYVFGEVEPQHEDMQVTVFAEQFTKLISKMTSDEVELNIADNGLQVIGNGDYALELPLDENGELIKFPDPYAENYKVDFKWDGKIKTSDIKTITESVKPSLATVVELPSITNYYVGENVVATDRYKVASLGVKLLNSDILITSQLMDLLSLCESDIAYKIDKDSMVFESGDCTIYSKRAGDVDEYPITVINSLIDDDFKSVCKVSKAKFIALLERISLFVGKYDDSAVRMYFEKDGIRVSNKDRKSNELLDYIDSKKYKSYDCVINVNMLLTQLKSYTADAVEIHYNNNKVIKFVDGNLVQIVALMTD